MATPILSPDSENDLAAAAVGAAPADPVALAAPVADVFYAELVFPGITDALARLATECAITAAMDPSQWHLHKGMRGWSHKFMAQVDVSLRAVWFDGMPDGIGRTLLRKVLASVPPRGPCFRLPPTG